MTPNDRVTLAETLRQIEQRSNIRFVFVTTSPTQYSGVPLARKGSHQVRAAFVKQPDRYGETPSQSPPLAIPLPGLRALLTAADLKDTMTVSTRYLRSGEFAQRVYAATPFASAYVDTRISEVLVNHLGMETMAIEAVAESATARKAITQSLLNGAAEAVKTLPQISQAQVDRVLRGANQIGGPGTVTLNPNANALVQAALPERPLLEVERGNYSYAMASMSAALAIMRTNTLPAVVDLDIPFDMRSGTLRSLDDLLNPETVVLRSDIVQSFTSLMQAVNEAANAQQNLPAEAWGVDIGPLTELVQRIVDETVENATGISGSGYPSSHFSDRAITYTGQPYEYRLLAAGPPELSVNNGAQLDMGEIPQDDNELQEWGTHALTQLGG